MVIPSYGEHGVALNRGATPAELLAIFRGVAHSGWDPTARRFGMYTIVLGAQLTATGVYERAGYERYGDVFDDAGIDHVMMRKSL